MSKDISEQQRQLVLDEVAKCVLKDRNKDYGDPEDNFADTAALWSAYKGVAFSRADIAAMMILLKVARLRTSLGKMDHWVDIAGYAACGYGSAVKDGEER